MGPDLLVRGRAEVLTARPPVAFDSEISLPMFPRRDRVFVTLCHFEPFGNRTHRVDLWAGLGIILVGRDPALSDVAESPSGFPGPGETLFSWLR